MDGVWNMKRKDWPCVQETRPQDHDRLARALLELHLDGRKLPPDDAHHPLNLLQRGKERGLN